MAGKTGLSQAGPVSSFQYDGHNCFLCLWCFAASPFKRGGKSSGLWKAGGTDDDERPKDLLVHQYIALKRGSIAPADRISGAGAVKNNA